MGSDYEFSDDDAEYYDDDEDMIDGTQDDEGLSALLRVMWPDALQRD